jgi:molecular chaperone DnaK
VSGADDLVLGIDLGTTFSAMSIVNRHGKPEILVNAEGHTTTPSVVHFYDHDGVVVGEEAVKMCVLDPEHVVRFIKRSMGEDGFVLDFFGHNYTPQEISALILRKLKEDAEALTGKSITDAVIIVLAYFNSPQRGATVEAGKIAGLNVLSVINEPTAAAIAYGIDKLNEDRTLLVFDLGGGTFDVTVMKVEGHKLQTLASDGNAELGGKDWDDRLLNYVAECFEAEHGIDPRDEPSAFQELYERCLAAKISLSTKDKAMVPVAFQGHRMAVSITRELFEDLTEDLVQMCLDTTTLVLDKARVSWAEIDDVLLVGGATRMPMIHVAIRTAFGKEPSGSINPDECVALGAALAGVIRYRPEHPVFTSAKPSEGRTPAPMPKTIERPSNFEKPQPRGISIGLADGGSRPPRPAPETPAPPNNTLDTPMYALPGDIEIQDASTHPLGIIVLDRDRQERVVELIAEGTPLPYEFHGRFTYAYDNMRAVRVEVTEGHGTYRDEVSVIAKVELKGLPPRQRGTPIDVIYRYGVDQILAVQVIDVETGQSRQVEVSFTGSLGAPATAAPEPGGRLDDAMRRNQHLRLGVERDAPPPVRGPSIDPLDPPEPPRRRS